MTNSPTPPDRPYVYAFGAKRLVLLASLVLSLVAFSLMLGIRIERYQQSAGEVMRQASPQEISKPVGSSSKTDNKAEPAESSSPVALPKTEVKPKAASAAPAKTKAPAPAKDTSPPPKKAVQRGHYAVQVESSQDRTKASLQVRLLKDKGFKSYLEEVDLGDKGRYFRVMVGPFQTKAEAGKVRSALAEDSRFTGSYIRYLP